MTFLSNKNNWLPVCFVVSSCYFLAFYVPAKFCSACWCKTSQMLLYQRSYRSHLFFLVLRISPLSRDFSVSSATACHSGKLWLAFTSPKFISTSPPKFWLAGLITQFFCDLNSSKNFSCSAGKVRTEFTISMAKSTSPGLSDSTFFARCSRTLKLTAASLCNTLRHLDVSYDTAVNFPIEELFQRVWWACARTPGITTGLQILWLRNGIELGSWMRVVTPPTE